MSLLEFLFYALYMVPLICGLLIAGLTTRYVGKQESIIMYVAAFVPLVNLALSALWIKSL